MIINSNKTRFESLGSFEVLKGGVIFFLILDLREAYIPNLSLLACLEPFEKVPVVVGSG